MVVYAVQSIPEPPEGQTSRDQRDRAIYRSAWQLLQGIADMPLLGVSPVAYREAVRAVYSTSSASREAAQSFQAAVENLVSLSATAGPQSIAPQISELVLKLSNL